MNVEKEGDVEEFAEEDLETDNFAREEERANVEKGEGAMGAKL
jgi:hypothetical protein